ncbi:hypothetical protein Csa_016786 [Cucumis sativus]|nr:hypothetical protein Csa_016786 [Cucumis sativus]
MKIISWNVQALDAIDSSGGIIVLWSAPDFTVQEIIQEIYDLAGVGTDSWILGGGFIVTRTMTIPSLLVNNLRHVVESWWSNTRVAGHPGHILMMKLKQLKSFIRSWANTQQSISSQLTNLVPNLPNLDNLMDLSHLTNEKLTSQHEIREQIENLTA